MRSLFGDVVALQTAQAASIFLAFITFWILGTSLSAADYGVYSLIVSAVSYLFVLTGSWNSQGFVRFAREEFTKERKLGAALAARSTLVGAACALCVAPLIVFPKELLGLAGVAPSWLWLVLALFALQLVSDALTGSLQAVADFRTLALYQVLDKGALLAAVAMAWAFPGPLTVTTLGVVVLAAKMVALIPPVVRLELSWLRRPASKHGSTLAPLWRYSSPLLLSAAIGYLPLLAGPSMVSHYLDAAEVGKYNVAYQLFGFYQAMTASVIATLFVPLFTDLVTGERTEALARVVGRYLPQLVFFNHLVVTVLVVSVTFLLPVVLPRYRESSTPLVLLLAGTGFQVVVSVYSALFAAFKVTRPVAIINVAGGVLFLALYALLVPRFGILALAGVWTGWYAVSAPVYLLCLRAHSAAVKAGDLMPAALSLLVLLLTLAPATAGARAALALGLSPVLLVAARAGGFFHEEDAAVVERAGLPPSLRSMVAGFYRWMHRPYPKGRPAD